MCQLTFTNLRSKRMNSLLYLIQSWENSVANQDGFGLKAGPYVLNAGISMRTCNNIGILLRNHYQTDDPILSHVRLATAIGGKKTVDDNTAHPFQSDNFVLAHNGMLELKEPNVEYKDEKVDTLVFLKELEKHYIKDNDVVKAIKETVDMFYGTFAFLIFHIPSSTYYAVRGTTKKLFLCEVLNGKHELGYILNTNDVDLQYGMLKFANLTQFLYNADIDWKKPVELDANSIYRLNADSVEKVGAVAESARPFRTTTEWATTQYHQGQVVNKAEKKIVDPELNKLIDIVTETGLTLEELDHICLATLKHGICMLEKESLKTLVSYLEKIHNSYSLRKDTIWETIKTQCFTHEKRVFPFALFPYQKYGIKFPYYLNTEDELEKILEKATNENVNSGK